MRFLETEIPGVVVVEPRVHRDGRGFFLETYHLDKYTEGGIIPRFVQDNHSKSKRGTLRGLHGQRLKPQGKLIRVVGHTDDIPILPKYHYKFPSNWELSAARAASVVNYLQKDLGLDPTNLEAVGRSFYDPIASNETNEGRAQNRRVNIIIAPMIE